MSHVKGASAFMTTRDHHGTEGPVLIILVSNPDWSELEAHVCYCVESALSRLSLLRGVVRDVDIESSRRGIQSPACAALPRRGDRPVEVAPTEFAQTMFRQLQAEAERRRRPRVLIINIVDPASN